MDSVQILSFNRSRNFSLSMFEHARDHLGAYRGLVGGRGGAVALGTIRKILSDLMRSELSEPSDTDSAAAVRREIVVQFVIGAYMAVLTWWLDRGARLPPQQIDAMFRRLATEGIIPWY
ncbi:MAG: TetR-like C-terminal domain-containing protein [Gammaproteobacteria bacterium]